MTDTNKRHLTLENLQKIAEDLLLRDGFLTPIVFLCSNEGACALELDSDYFEDDDTKDQMVQALVEKVTDCGAYKIFFISECWIYEASNDVPLHEYREKYSKKEEGFQIVEIIRDSMRFYNCTFLREEDKITLGKRMTTEDAELVRFKPLQQALTLLD